MCQHICVGEAGAEEGKSIGKPIYPCMFWLQADDATLKHTLYQLLHCCRAYVQAAFLTATTPLLLAAATTLLCAYLRDILQVVVYQVLLCLQSNLDSLQEHRPTTSTRCFLVYLCTVACRRMQEQALAAIKLSCYGCGLCSMQAVVELKHAGHDCKKCFGCLSHGRCYHCCYTVPGAP
jgi:hypothetical protein